MKQVKDPPAWRGLHLFLSTEQKEGPPYQIGREDLFESRESSRAAEPSDATFDDDGCVEIHESELNPCTRWLSRRRRFRLRLQSVNLRADR